MSRAQSNRRTTSKNNPRRVIRAAVEPLEDRRLMSVQTIHVNTAVDEDNGTASPFEGTGTSLREALALAASLTAYHWELSFASHLATQTIQLTTVGGNAFGDYALGVVGQVTIIGNGVTIRRADSAPDMRLFNVNPGGNLTLDSLTLTNGRASDGFGFRLGGAILNYNGQLTVKRSTLTGNSGTSGGAIWNQGLPSVTTIENSTITGNIGTTRGSAVAGDGGQVRMHHVTICGNSGGSEAVSGNGFQLPGLIVNLNNTIISGNVGGEIGGVGVTVTGDNNYVGGNAMLQPLASNGGKTQTMRPSTGSPVIDAGVASSFSVDQRNIARPQGAGPDIGAVEARLLTQSPVLGITSLNALSTESVHLPTRLQATPAGGTFSGPGVSGVTFNASAAGVGTHQITYTLVSPDGITATTTANINVISNATTLTIETPSVVTYAGSLGVTIRVSPAPGAPANYNPTGWVTVNLDGTPHFVNRQVSAGTGNTSVFTAVFDRLQSAPGGRTYAISATFTSANLYAGSSGELTGGLTVNQREVTVYNLNLNKTYDGIAATGVSGGQLAGWISPDQVGLNTSNATATFEDANAGVNKPVIVTGLSLSGVHSNNYFLTQPLATTATIAARPVSVTGLSVVPRTFDGTSTATLEFNNAGLTNVLTQDAAGVSLDASSYVANFDSPQPGLNKPVAVSGLALTGTAAANYSAVQPTGLTGSISEAPSLLVDTALDAVNAFDGATSLREAVRFAEQTNGADTVTFDAALAGQTLMLSDGWNNVSDDAAIRVAGDLTIQAPAGGVTLAINSAGPDRRHFAVHGGGRLAIDGAMILADGRTGYGGAIYNDGEINLEGVTFRNNRANDLGGAVFNQGTLNLIGCTFDTNTAFQGGAIQSSGILSIVDSTFQNNSADFNAGALRLFGQATISGSTFNGNTAGNDGGALISFNQLTAVNSTFADNGATAVVIWTGSADLSHLTVARNRSWGLSINNDAEVTIRNTIIAGNPTGNLYGTPTSTSSGNLLNVSASEARLGALADNGGPTQTIALLPGSPAINAAAVSEATTDQRGFVRPQGGLFDIGAYERLGSNLTMLSSSFEFETRAAVNFSFDADASVNFFRQNISITNLTTGQPVPSDVGTLMFDETGENARLTLTNLLPNGDYRLVSFGGSLDFFILAGDANRDRTVDIDDFSVLASRFNLPGTFSEGDFDYSGTTDIEDFGILAAGFNTVVGATQAMSAARTSDRPHASGSDLTGRQGSLWSQHSLDQDLTR